MDHQAVSNTNDLAVKVRDEAKRLLMAVKSIREQKQDGNEQFTKMVLILPMLRTLGYTTDSFPPEVRPEYQIKLTYSKVETKYVDYAIHIDNSPTPSIFVEAKALCKNLDDYVEQLASYHKQEDGVKISILTNGEEWRIYMTKDGHSSDMSQVPILKVTLSSLVNNKDRLKDFIDYIARKNFVGDSRISLSELVKKNSERDALYETFRNLFNCKAADDSELLDDDFVKYILKKSQIEIKLTSNAKDIYRVKIFDALQHELEVLKATYYNQMTSEKLGIQQPVSQPIVNPSNATEKPITHQPAPTQDTSENEVTPYTELEKQINKEIYSILISSNSEIIKNNIDKWSQDGQLKYYNAPQFIRFVISNRTQPELNDKTFVETNIQTCAISYGNRSQIKDPDSKDSAQYKLENGAFGFNIPEIDSSEFLNHFTGYNFVQKKSAAGFGTYIGIYTFNNNLVEQLNTIKDIIIYCYEKALLRIISK